MKKKALFGLMLLIVGVGLAYAPAPVAAEPPERVVFASAGFTETNRFWTVARPDLLQYDPFLETLMDIDPKTGKYVPRLAERWEVSPDAKTWTFYLRKGVQFHYGFGEMTARDVVHTHALISAPDAKGSLTAVWRTVDNVEAVDDYTVVFHMKVPAVTLPFAASRSGDLRIVSKAQWEQEGVEGFDKRPAGTGIYRFVSRKLGDSVSYERVDDHWSGEKPDFKYLDIILAQEEATRLALILSGKAHVADLSRQLQDEALNKGMKILNSQIPVDWLSVYMGGQYYIPGDPKASDAVPWRDKKVRQALNMAINRDEMLASIFKGKGKLVYVSGFSDTLDGWNPEWPKQFDAMYGYNPEKAQALLKEAGYPPKQLKMKVLGFSSPGEEELPQVAEALSLYFHDIGLETEVQIGEWSRIRHMMREKEVNCCIWPNIISLRPIQEWIRGGYYSKEGIGKIYEHPFIDEKYEALRQTTDPEERDRIAREVGDYMFENIADIPLFLLFNEVVANPKVVDSWTYPGTGGGRTTHFHLLKAAK